VVILQSSNVLELAKDFVALMIIAEFDNMFAKYSEQMIVKDILDAHKKDYEELFKIETTTSSDCQGVFNRKLNKDEIWPLIQKRLKDNDAKEDEKRKKAKKCSSGIGCCKPAKEREVYVGIGCCRPRSSCMNRFLYMIYGILRFLYVTIWFYYLPVIMMAISYMYLNWRQMECRQDNLSGSRLRGGICMDPSKHFGESIEKRL